MLIGHKKQWQFLKRSAELGRLSHAYLFSGPSKVGKRALAQEWASFLINADIKSRIHPDFDLVLPQLPEGEETGKKEIKISQIRDLIWKLSLKPSLAPLKVAILDECHLMNFEAQNSFLKTLEEPKDKTILILISEHPDMLLPTIRSRCEFIKFQPVPKKEIDDYFKKEGIGEKLLQEISEISLGRPGEAMDFISNPQKLNDWKASAEKLVKMANSTLAARFQYAKELAERSDLAEILEIWLAYFRGIMISKISADKNRKEDYPLEAMRKIVAKIQNTIFLLSSTNANSRLALEALMLEF